MVAPLACGACVVAGLTYVGVQDPSEGGVFVPCPFRVVTGGLWCPGCGLTRATHHLLHGDLVAAMRFNLFVVAILTAMAASWWRWCTVAAGHQPLRRHPIPGWSVTVAIVVMVAFGVLRNLPGIDGLRG